MNFRKTLLSSALLLSTSALAGGGGDGSSAGLGGSSQEQDIYGHILCVTSAGDILSIAALEKDIIVNYSSSMQWADRDQESRTKLQNLKAQSLATKLVETNFAYSPVAGEDIVLIGKGLLLNGASVSGFCPSSTAAYGFDGQILRF